MKVKTNELSGAVLDWAVAKAEGLAEGPNGSFWVEDEPCDFEPISNWAQGGPIIEREKINLEWKWEWRARLWADSDEVFVAPTPLVAAMRCYVASKLGEEVEVPEEVCDENL